MTIETSEIYQQFAAQNQASQRHATSASAVIPSASSRSLLRHPPFPFYVREAHGISSIDLDGNERLDFHNNYTTMIHGHGHAVIREAIEQQLDAGTSYSAPGAHEFALAELLTRRIRSVEQVVFNNSGTEAVMVALRLARAFTGRNRIGLFEGSYHGSYDFVLVGGHDLPAADDPVRVSKPSADMAGLPEAATEDVIMMRYNDPEAVREACAQSGDELAAIIVEPILGAGGVIPGEAEFLQVLRDETARAGIVLICDEVISLRQALGGAQGYYGLEPDLTTMAKTIGGGFPVGAVGGRRDIMHCLDAVEDGGSVANLGTFSANPMSMCAGHAAMALLDEAAIGHINELGRQARGGVAKTIEDMQLPAQVSGTGSLFQIHWTEASLKDARGVMTSNAELNTLTFLGMANRGVQLSMRGIGALSTPMSGADINTMLEAFSDTASQLRAEHRC